MLVPTHKTLEESWRLSADLWRQVAPTSEGTTQYFARPHEHPITGEWYFEMTQEDAARFGLDADNALTEWPKIQDDNI